MVHNISYDAAVLKLPVEICGAVDPLSDKSALVSTVKELRWYIRLPRSIYQVVLVVVGCYGDASRGGIGAELAASIRRCIGAVSEIMLAGVRGR